LPVSWRGTIAQYAGRLHRLCEGKREVRIYDYADLNVSMFARMFDRRCRGYEALAARGSSREFEIAVSEYSRCDLSIPADLRADSGFQNLPEALNNSN